MLSPEEPTCRCGKVMTRANSTLAPEFFLCDECAQKEGWGRTATVSQQEFVWRISERQFQVIWNHDGKQEMMAQSSSMSTFLKCMSDMMKAAGKDVTFEVVQNKKGR